MPLAAGSQVGPYEILSPLGAGGMGEVYRARDTRLNRDVALKVLPEAFVLDPDRLARFKREAQVLASLNHPNIAHIYGLEEGPAEAGRHLQALVMELVEGDDLSQRIARGAIPLDEALPIARQMCEALEAAHEQGIIHRDLKPANIKVRPNGTVKVLDFGLAKAVETSGSGLQASGHDVTHSPTITSPAMTLAGMILGTAAYMSPEQAAGKAADKRSDLWAFGVVLLEMLTGRQAFSGETVSHVLAAVLKDAPDWTMLPAITPAPIRRLLRRCLEKDRKRRLDSAADARLEIDEALAAPLAEATVGRVATRSAAPAWRRALPWAVAAGGLGLAAWLAFRPVSPTVRPVTRFVMTLPPGVSVAGAQSGPNIALSPDGTRLAYVASASGGPNQLYVRSISQLESTTIRGTDNATLPFFSPDGRWIGFAADGKLKKVPVDGGPPQLICDAPASAGATWSEDGSIVFASFGGTAGTQGGSRLWRVPADGGTAVGLTNVDGKAEVAHRWPEALPGGKALLFAIHRVGVDANGAAIGLLRLDTGERRIVMEGGTAPHYLSGYLTFVRAGAVVAVPFDLRTMTVTGPPISGVEDIATNQNGSTLFGVSASGTIAYKTGVLSQAARLVWVDRHGVIEPIRALPARRYERPRISPDGRLITLTITRDDSSGRDVWLYDIARGALTRFTYSTLEAETPVWTPDGKHITYAAVQDTQRAVAWKASDGSGAEEVLGTTDRHLHVTSWAPGAGALIGAINTGPDQGTVWLLDMAGKRSLRRIIQGPSPIRGPVFSPDGKWLAYEATDAKRSEVYVQAFPGPGPRSQVSTEGGNEPIWARSGRELFFQNGTKMMAVSIEPTGETLRIGTPALLFEGQFVSGTGNFDYFDITPDGHRFVMIKSEDSQAVSSILVVQNWPTELKARVRPTP